MDSFQSNRKYVNILLLVSILFVLFGTTSYAQQFIVKQLRDLSITSGSSFTFDISFEVNIPSIGGSQITLEFDLETTITFMNSSIHFRPIKIPYLIMPETRPIEFSIGDEENHAPPPSPVYPYDPYSYDAYETDSPYFQPIDSERRSLLKPQQTSKGMKMETKDKKSIKKKKKKTKSKKSRTKTSMPKADYNASNYTKQIQHYHYRNRRSLASTSAQHRSDIFTMLSETMNHYGLDGQVCICRAVCELAEMELLIESPLHEAIEHLFRVSRANDDDGLLKEYIDAELFGHQNAKSGKFDECEKRYVQCPFSIFDRNDVYLY